MGILLRPEEGGPIEEEDLIVDSVLGLEPEANEDTIQVQSQEEINQLIGLFK